MAKKQEARDWLEHHKQDQIAAVDAKLRGHGQRAVPTLPANAAAYPKRHRRFSGQRGFSR